MSDEPREPNGAVRIAAKALYSHASAAATLIRNNHRGWAASLAVEILESLTEADCYAICWESLDRMTDKNKTETCAEALMREYAQQKPEVEKEIYVQPEVPTRSATGKIVKSGPA